MIYSCYKVKRLSLFTEFSRSMRIEGWMTSISNRKTKDRDKEQERKQRQIDKLPETELIPNFAYPEDKKVITDIMFQPTYYKNHLDTPHLLNISDYGVNYVLGFNKNHFNLTDYPPLPDFDTRYLLSSKIDSKSSNSLFQAHRQLLLEYATKHELVPHMIPSMTSSVNVTAVFDSEPHPGGTLSKANYWRSTHAGNYIPVKHLRCPPVIALFDGSDNAVSGNLYTVVIATPDYPFRASPNEGWYVLGLTCNVVPGLLGGDVVVPYLQPLPHEGAGLIRVVCMALGQHAALRGTSRAEWTEERALVEFPFALRSNFRLFGDPQAPPVLAGLEAVLAGPVGFSFAQTQWDDEVSEFYAKHSLQEPLYIPSDVAQALAYNAQPTNAHQVKGRYLEDGSCNDWSVGDQRLTHRMSLMNSTGHIGSKTQYHKARLEHRTLTNTTFSRKTLLSKDKKYYQRPNMREY